MAMDDGNKEDGELDSINQSKGTCGKQMIKISETERVMPCGEKERGRCSNENLDVSGHRKMARPKLRWSDDIRKDMKEKGAQITEAQDRRTWRLKI